VGAAAGPGRPRDPRALLEALPPEVRDIVRAAREVVLRIAPGVEETVLWDGLSYHRPEVGGRVKGAVCLLSAKGGRVRLEFIHGVRLSDPGRLLQGNRLSKRFVPLRRAADAESPGIAALLRDAATQDPATWTDPPAPPPRRP